MPVLIFFLGIVAALAVGIILPVLLVHVAINAAMQALIASGIIDPQSFFAVVGPALFLFLGLVPILALLMLHKKGILTQDTALRIASPFVPDLLVRVHQGQQAIDTYVRDALEQGHATRGWDLSAWNGRLRYTNVWGLKVQWEPNMPYADVQAICDDAVAHDPNMERHAILPASGCYDGLWVWQRGLVYLCVHTHWDTHKMRYSAHEMIMAHRRRRAPTNRAVAFLYALA